MFLRESRQHRVRGDDVIYLQLVESVWDPEKKSATTRIVHNFGRASDPKVRESLKDLARSILRRVSPEELGGGREGFRAVDAWPFGDLYVLEALWEKVGMKKLLPSLTRDATKSTLPVERACFAMVANRCCAPSSKLYCFEQWIREDVRIAGWEDLELHHLYRAMDFFEAHKEDIEKELFFKVADLFTCDVDLVFYDTTNVHFEVDKEDSDGKDDVVVHGSKLAGGKEYEALRQRGHAKNHRDDAPLVSIGLAVTRNGLPIRSWVFRGDTVDVETVTKVKADLKGWKLTRCVFVGDAGMYSKGNLKALADGVGKYVLCVPMKVGEQRTEEVLSRPGRYQELAPNLHVKEIVIGEGERRERYVLCYNPDEAERQRLHRSKIVADLEAILWAMYRDDSEPRSAHTKRECQLRASERYGRFLVVKNDRLCIDRAKATELERMDGKFLVCTNDDTLSTADVALAYKQLASVESAWRMVKSGMRIRPVFHWVPHRICAHVSLTMIGLLLERLAENACHDTWRNIRDDLRQVKLVQLSTPQGTVWQVTEPGPAASKRLKQLGIPPPPPVFKIELAPSNTGQESTPPSP